MRNLILSGLLMASVAISAEASDIPSQLFGGEAILSLSPGGKWMVSELDSDKSLLIRNLETGESWRYEWDGTDFGTSYPAAMGRCASDNGVILGEVSDVPSYWENGKWTALKGYLRDSAGAIRAILGGITADGSMIVGGMGKGGSAFDEDGSQLTYPCVWYRQEDGSYSEPEWLPIPGVEFFGLPPQYLQCTDVSLDGNTIAATMTTWNGYWHQPYAYTRNEDGSWTYHELGMELINPTGMEIMKFPGEYNGPVNPNYELYLTPEQLTLFYTVDGPEWIDSLYRQGITEEEEIAILELSYVMKYMDEKTRADYELLLNAFLEEYVPWRKAYTEYEEFLLKFSAKSHDFMFNNGKVSPDGRYVYSTATSLSGGRGMPVRFDMETGETKVYETNINLMTTCVTADYSILAWGGNADPDGAYPAYIFPEGADKPVEITEFFRSNGMDDNYLWMEENFYQSVVIGLTSTGIERFDDRWSVGRPVSTPDMSLIGFGTSTLYWETPPKGNGLHLTGILNTGMDVSGIQEIEVDDSPISSDSPARYYNLQGVPVSQPGHGIYIMVKDGRSSKVIL